MKNLKKVLALVLALSTIFGLGISASATYTDAKDIEYTEAVDVMSAIGVLGGNPDGSFAPQKNLTRAQAAKMVAYIMNSGKDVNDLYAGANAFTDCTNSWAKGYIAFAQQAGVIAGVGNGKFNPDGTLTGVALAKMMLVSLGYDANTEGYQNNDSWALNIINDANAAGLLDGLDSSNLYNAITREQASQMMFNALKATTVKYTSKGTSIDLGNGIIINSGDATVEEVANNGTENYKDDGLMQLCEKFFEDLTYSTAETKGQDAFGRPAHSWSFDGAIGTYADTAKFTYTAAVSPEDMKKDLENYTVSDVAYTKNGEKQSTLKDAAAIAGVTGNGTVVELFVTDKAVTKVVVTESTFGKVGVKSVSESKSRGAYTQYTIDNKGYNVFSTVVDEDKDVDTAVVTGDIKNGDMAVYYVVDGKAYITAVTKVTGALTAISSSKEYTIGGEKYALSKATGAQAPELNKESADYYIDAYGYLLGAVETTSDTTYAMVLESDKESFLTEDNKIEEKFYALVAYADGTVTKLTTDQKYTAGGLYTIGDTEDGETALVSVEEPEVVTSITKGSATLGTTKLLVNNNTNFIFVDYKDDKVAGTVTTYTGRNNVITVDSIESGAFAVDTDGDEVADVVYVYAQVSESVSDEYVYVKGTYSTTADGTAYDVIIKGEETTLTLKNAKLDEGLYSKVVDKSTGSVKADEDDVDDLTEMEYVAGVLKTAGGNYTIEDNVAVYMIDEYDDTCVTMTASELSGKVDGKGYAVLDGDAITTLYVVWNSNAN